MGLNLRLQTVRRGFVEGDKYFLKEILNPKNGDKHVLRIDSATNTLVRNDFYVKDKSGEYKLSSQRFFGYKYVSTVIKDLLTGDTKERRVESFIPTKRYKQRIIVNPSRTKIKYITVDKEKGVETHSYYEKGQLIHNYTIEQAREPVTFAKRLQKLKYKLDYFISEAFLF